jgi:hypothetical protein
MWSLLRSIYAELLHSIVIVLSEVLVSVSSHFLPMVEMDISEYK